MDAVLYHHGVPGQKWGIRRYQYADGSLTPKGRKRNQIKNTNGIKRIIAMANMKVSDAYKSSVTIITGKQYVDSCLNKNTSFKRIQTSKDFEKFAFYATYKKQDSEKYMGLFGKNLISRAKKEAKMSRDELAIKKANNMKVYQLSINATKRLKVPSDENASSITAKLLKDSSFKKNVEESISDSKSKMKRPSQQLLFAQAQNALTKDPNKMSYTEKKAVYKALNLSLTNHNLSEVAAQNRFYSELKKKGYNALLDYNDKEYSSYHAKRPMIVFDTNSVKLQSVIETNPKLVNKLYSKYNAERITKEIGANTIGYIAKMGTMRVSDCNDYVQRRMNDYLSN